MVTFLRREMRDKDIPPNVPEICAYEYHENPVNKQNYRKLYKTKIY